MNKGVHVKRTCVMGLVILTVLLTVALSSCSMKPKINDSALGAQKELVRPGTKLKQSGFLKFTDTSRCDLSTGCGAEFSLLNASLSEITPLGGKFSIEHHNLLVEVEGKSAKVNKKYMSFLQSSSSGYAINVKRYRLLSKIPYHKFLIEQAELFTQRTYGCSVLWDKSFGWEVVDERALLKVRMTDSLNSSETKSFLELTFDGTTGHLFKQELQPWGSNPCT